jgi:hypothetical protein
MQVDINDEGWPLETRMLGVNLIGAESGNTAICTGRSIPWLQDTDQQKSWEKWAVTWRDVV